MSTKRKSWQATAAVAAAAAMALIGGCNGKAKQDEDAEAEARVNTAIVRMHFDDQARGGATTGRTIYPYHFVADQAGLTPLGEEHVQTLAQALAEEDGKPVRLNVRRGDASTELYDARVATLKERFAQAGVEADRLVFADGLGGGKGISSKALADAERAAASGGNPSGGGGGPTGPSTGYKNGMQSQRDR